MAKIQDFLTKYGLPTDIGKGIYGSAQSTISRLMKRKKSERMQRVLESGFTDTALAEPIHKGLTEEEARLLGEASTRGETAQAGYLTSMLPYMMKEDTMAKMEEEKAQREIKDEEEQLE